MAELRRKGRRRLEAVRRDALDACTRVEFLLQHPCAAHVGRLEEALSRLQASISELRQKPRLFKRPGRVTPPE